MAAINRSYVLTSGVDVPFFQRVYVEGDIPALSHNSDREMPYDLARCSISGMVRNLLICA